MLPEVAAAHGPSGQRNMPIGFTRANVLDLGRIGLAATGIESKVR
jgi:hypothetical protein